MVGVGSQHCGNAHTVAMPTLWQVVLSILCILSLGGNVLTSECYSMCSVHYPHVAMPTIATVDPSCHSVFVSG